MIMNKTNVIGLLINWSKGSKAGKQRTWEIWGASNGVQAVQAVTLQLRDGAATIRRQISLAQLDEAILDLLAIEAQRAIELLTKANKPAD